MREQVLVSWALYTGHIRRHLNASTLFHCDNMQRQVVRMFVRRAHQQVSSIPKASEIDAARLCELADGPFARNSAGCIENGSATLARSTSRLPTSGFVMGDNTYTNGFAHYSSEVRSTRAFATSEGSNIIVAELATEADAPFSQVHILYRSSRRR